MAEKRTSKSKSESNVNLSPAGEVAEAIMAEGFETESNAARFGFTTMADGAKALVLVVRTSNDARTFGRSAAGNVQLIPKGGGLTRGGTTFPLSLITGDDDDDATTVRLGGGFYMSRPPTDEEDAKPARKGKAKAKTSNRGSF